MLCGEIGTWNRQISTITGLKYSLQNYYIGTCSIGLYFVRDIVMQDVHVHLNPGSLMRKRRSARRFFFFRQQIRLKFREETSEVLHLEHSFCMVLTLGHLRKVDQKYLESSEM